MACGIIVSRLGIEPVTLTVEAQTANHWPSGAVPGLLLLLSQGLCGGRRACGLHLSSSAVDARILALRGHTPWKSLAVTSWPCSSTAGDGSPSGVSGCSGRFEGITLNGKPLHEFTWLSGCAGTPRMMRAGPRSPRNPAPVPLSPLGSGGVKSSSLCAPGLASEA